MQPGLPIQHPTVKPRRSRALIIALSIMGGFVALCAVCTVGVIIGGDDQVRMVRSSDPAATEHVPTAAAPLLPTVKPLPAMPDVVGKNAAVALDDLKRLGITNVTLGSVDSAATVVVMPENWVVAEQSVVAGVPVADGGLVVLGCRKSRSR